MRGQSSPPSLVIDSGLVLCTGLAERVFEMFRMFWMEDRCR